MIPAPFRARILIAVADQLAMIQAGVVVYSDPGAATIEYRSTPKTVTRSVLSMDQYEPKDAWPLLGVIRGSGSTVMRLSHDRTSDERVFEHLLKFNTVGYVRGAHPTSAEAALAGDLLEDLWEDHHTCLRRDPTLGGLVKDLAPDGEMQTDDGAYEPDAMFIQPWLARAIERT